MLNKRIRLAATLILSGALNTVGGRSALCSGPQVVQWSLTASTRESVPIKKGAMVAAHLHATILKGWHLYSLSQQPYGPAATKISVSLQQPFKLSGDIIAQPPLTAFDTNFDLRTSFYEDQASFEIPLETIRSNAEKVAVDVLYQACSDTMCLAPTTMHVLSSVQH